MRSGDTRGAFFFRQGKLVDARVGPFTGFVAINLAVSIVEPRLTFDPSIEPPPSRFKDLAERTLLKNRFGIDTLDAEVTGNETKIAEVGKETFESTVQVERPEATSPRLPYAAGKVETATSASLKPWQEVFSSGETNELNPSGPLAFTAKLQQTQTSLATIHPTYPTRVKRLLTHNTRNRIGLRAGFIILVVIPAAVATTSYWTNGEQPSALNEARPLRAQPLLTPTPSQDAVVIPIIEPVRAAPARPASNPQILVSEDPKTLLVEDVKTPPLEVPDRNTKGIKNVPTAEAATEDNVSEKPSARTVVVVVQIAEGHVTEAYIQNPQVGLRAYESTALRIARERRYSKDTNRKETVIVKLAERQ
ncbi:MAG: hypothetical protein ABR556_12285 [Pyrinomonadaceae bacterium]